MRTSKKSGNSSRAGSPSSKPFDPALLKRARKLAGSYRLILETDEELGYIGSSIEMPIVFADGNTPDECVQATREALAVAVATMLERGARPPTSRGRRSVQVNVRLTPDEKFTLQEAATRMGFRGISDFVRAIALERGNAA